MAVFLFIMFVSVHCLSTGYQIYSRLVGYMEVSLRCAMVLSDSDWTYQFSSLIANGLWVAAIVGVDAPLFLRLFCQFQQ